jgi:hypothetical protein
MIGGQKTPLFCHDRMAETLNRKWLVVWGAKLYFFQLVFYKS